MNNGSKSKLRTNLSLTPKMLEGGVNSGKEISAIRLTYDTTTFSMRRIVFFDYNDSILLDVGSKKKMD